MIIEGTNKESGDFIYLEVSSIEFDHSGNITNFNSIANLDLISSFEDYTDWRFRVFK